MSEAFHLVELGALRRSLRALPLALAAVLVAVASAGCDQLPEPNPPTDVRRDGTPVGHGDPSSAGLQPASGLAPRPDDLDAVRARGVELAAMERSLALAADGISSASTATNPLILPIARVDPGHRSSQVTYWRWLRSSIGFEGEVKPEAAERWIVVPVLLSRNSILENEIVSGHAEPGTDEYNVIAAILLATAHARAEHPGAQWHVHPVRERDATIDEPGRNRTRVYMLGVEGAANDLEIVVSDEVTRGKERTDRKGNVKPRKILAPPKIVEVVEVHRRDRSGALSMLVDIPAPLSVARVIAHASPSQMTAADGSRWEIEADGTIRKLSEGKRPEQKESEAAAGAGGSTGKTADGDGPAGKAPGGGGK